MPTEAYHRKLLEAGLSEAGRQGGKSLAMQQIFNKLREDGH